MATFGEQLAAAVVTDALNGTREETVWSKLAWATSRGTFGVSGWSPPGYISLPPTYSNGGAFYKPLELSGGNGFSYLTIPTSFSAIAGAEPRRFSVWLFTTGAGTANGYQLQLVQESEGSSEPHIYKAVISRYVAGAPTILLEVSGVQIEAGGAFSLNCFGGKLSCWVRKTAIATWLQAGGEASDATFASGFSGIDGDGSNPVLNNFAIGTLTTPTSSSLLPATTHIERYTLDPIGITLRHIKRGTAGSPGAKKVLGIYYYPDPNGLNGRQGFQSGQYERKLEEEGTFSIKLANAAGSDGLLHRDRFAVITEDDFRPGDEFIEIWRGKELLFVGVPVSYELGLSTITISGYSPFWLLKKTRETAAGYWASSPRDAMQYYLSVWQVVVGKDFSGWTYGYSGTQQVTADGWSYTYTEDALAGGAVKMKPGAKNAGSYLISPEFDLPWNFGSGLHQSWRVDVRFRIVSGMVSEAGQNNSILVAFGASFGLIPGMEANATGFYSLGPQSKYGGEGGQFKGAGVVGNGDHAISVEGRDKWLYFYFDGKLVGQTRSNFDYAKLNEPNLSKLWISVVQRTNTPIEILVYSALLRKTQPFLFNPAAPGDYMLPGAPVPAGLEGHYFLDHDIYARGGGNKLGQILHPSREVDPATADSGGLYQRRVDPVINFPEGAPAGWQPPGPSAGEMFSCRWIGAVYLALDDWDYAFRFTCDDRARMWIGKTQAMEEYLEDWNSEGHSMTLKTGPWIKAGNSPPSAPSGSSGLLAGMGSGWYPIVIEYSQGAGGAGMIVEYTRDGAGWNYLGATSGNFSLPPEKILKLSPLGIYQDIVQFDSHYDAFKNIAGIFGYQWLDVPKSLESGLFPGYVEPKIRVGRNTDYVLDSVEATDVANQGNADDVADGIVAEGQGLGDPGQSVQLTIEKYALPANDQLFFVQESEQVSDINLEGLLLQRADSLLALHSSPWEEVGARPRGHRELIDSFPLTGDLEEFGWEPGDGLRLRFPQIGVDDQLPRQIQGISWPFTPDNLGIPNAAFKQRPRNFLLTLRSMLRGTIASQRNYQGQITKYTGTLGGNTGAQSADSYSRCPMPGNLADVIRATLVVQVKTDTSSWTIEVNGVSTGMTFTRAARFDITPWTTRDSTNPRCYARCFGGTGALDYVIELMVRV